MNIFESLENLNVSEECFDEIMGIVEEIINEVSVGNLSQKATKSLEKAKVANQEAIKNFKKEQKKEQPDELKLSRYADEGNKAAQKYRNAKRIVDLNLPKNSKVKANELFKKADKVQTERFEKSIENPIRGEQNKSAFRDKKRAKRAIEIAKADPVVNREDRKGLSIK